MLEDEQRLLGVCLQFEKYLPAVFNELTLEMFYHKQHRDIFSACRWLYQKGKTVDIVTVADLLERGKRDPQRAYLAGLCEAVASPRITEHTIERIRQDHIRRLLNLMGAQMMSDLGQPEDRDITAYIQGLQKQLYELTTSRQRFEIKTTSDIVLEVSKLAEEGIKGLASGFFALDHKTLGFKPGEMILIAGRPSVGKTSLALNITEYIGMVLREPVLFVSLEMGGNQLVQRMLASNADISGYNIASGKMSDDEWQQFGEAAMKIGNANILVLDVGLFTSGDLLSLGRYAVDVHKVKIIIIDYLQLMRSGLKTSSRNEEVSEISRGIKLAANELAVPIIALSQLSRFSEKAQRRPRLDDLRDSGSLEQDADVVMLVHRERGEDGHFGSETDLIIAKQRNMPTGTIKLTFEESRTRFVPAGK